MPTLYALPLVGAVEEPLLNAVAPLLSDGERLMLVDATVVSPVLALGR